MQERKAAIINVSKGLLNVSLATLTAVGGATGNPLVAGAAAIPQALTSSGILKPLLEKKQEEHLELPIPPWWTEGPQSQSWQTVCSSIESRLPEIIKGAKERIRKETSYPSPSDIKRIFAEQIAQHLSPWEVKSQDRQLVAGYVTPPLLEKSAAVLKAVIGSTREEALAKLLIKIADTLEDAQKSTTSITSTSSPGAVMQANMPTAPITGASQSSQSVASILEQKRQNDAYDVYICYDGADEVEVMDIGEKLKVYGILPWFDLLEVKPGTPEKRQQEQQILRIPAAAVFVGQHKIVDKQELQMYGLSV